MKSLFVLASALFCMTMAAPAAAIESMPHKALTPKEKAADTDLTFCLTFDDLSCNALGVSAGNRLPRNGKKNNLAVGKIAGFDGMPACRQEPGEELLFESKGNVKSGQGTLVFWLNAENYSPPDIRKAKSLSLIKCHFSDGKDNLDIALEMCFAGEPKGISLNWSSTVPPNGWGWNPSVRFQLTDIKKGQWNQIAGTWDDREIKLYCNGDLVGKNEIDPNKSRRATTIRALPKYSFIRIGSAGNVPIVKDMHTAVDDIKIFKRVLSAAEIKLQYLRTIPATSMNKDAPPPVVVELNGVDDGNGGLDRVEVLLDISALRAQWQTATTDENAVVRYKIAGPNGFVKDGQWRMADQKVLMRVVGGLKEKGEYVFTFLLHDGNHKEFEVSRKLVKPDTSWYGNSLGKDDAVPSPWPALKIDATNTIALWNRTYKFIDGPFPSEILCGERQLLNTPPTLVVETAAGIQPLKSKITGREVHNSHICFTGEFTDASFFGNFKTTVEFDGLIKTELVIKGQPEIKSMRSEWKVNPEFTKYLMLPRVAPENQTQIHKFPYEISYESTNLLWLVSELGGFCWAPANDANWVYQEGEKILEVNKRTGQCTVKLVSCPVKLPPDTNYTFLFTATPTRPLWNKRRTYRFCGPKPFEPTIPPPGMGFHSLADFIPSDADFKWMEDKKSVHLGPRRLFFYGVGAFLTEQSDVAKYFKKYWNRPGAYQYMMSKWSEGTCIDTPSLSSCLTHTSKGDFLVNNINVLLNSSYLKYIDGAYFDCSAVTECNNELHGCRFPDKFGRMISDTNLLSLRELFKRSVDVFHQHDRWLALHSQWRYNPMAHGLGDFWMPGEQYRRFVDKTVGSREAYFDKKIIRDDILRSEFNAEIMGTGIVTLVYPANENDDGTAMMTRLMLEDISFWGRWGNGKFYDSVFRKVWDTFEKYNLDDASCHRHNEQQIVKSSNPDVAITYYQCPRKRYLLIVGNTCRVDREATIDLSRLKRGNYTVVDEFNNENISATDGELKLKVTPYNFRLIGINL